MQVTELFLIFAENEQSLRERNGEMLVKNRKEAIGAFLSEIINGDDGQKALEDIAFDIVNKHE